MPEQNKLYATTEIFGALVAMACEESPQFHEQFSRNPRRMLNKYLAQQKGVITVDDSINIVVHENDADTLHVVAPAYKTVGSVALSDEQLGQIAAGEVIVSGAYAAVLTLLGVVGAGAATAAFGTAATASLSSGAAIALGAVTIGVIGATAVGAGALASGAAAGVVVGGLAAAGQL